MISDKGFPPTSCITRAIFETDRQHYVPVALACQKTVNERSKKFATVISVSRHNIHLHIFVFYVIAKLAYSIVEKLNDCFKLSS